MFSTQVNEHLLIKNFYVKMLHAIGKIYSSYEAHIIVYRGEIGQLGVVTNCAEETRSPGE